MNSLRLTRLIVGTLGAAAIMVFSPLLIGSALLIFVAETWAGRLAALSLWVALIFTILIARAVSAKKWVVAAPLGLILAFGVVMAAVFSLPEPPSSRVPPPVVSHYLRAEKSRDGSWIRLVPEIDQVKLGTYVAPLIDPYLSSEEGAEVRELAMAIYRAMEADPAWAEVESVMADAYRERDTGHLYQIVPKYSPDEKLPLIIFLHGSAGNFKSYSYLWRKFADTHRVIVVSPSFGFGNWQKKGGVDVVRRAKKYALDELPADPARVYLAGLSNGGRAMTRVMKAGDRGYKGLIFLSAVIEPDILAQTSSSAWAGTPALVIHGDRDDRIPLPYVQAGVDQLNTIGLLVQWVRLPDRDHFLFFSEIDRVWTEVADFIER